jgi:hypothetical protein
MLQQIWFMRYKYMDLRWDYAQYPKDKREKKK